MAEKKRRGVRRTFELEGRIEWEGACGAGEMAL